MRSPAASNKIAISDLRNACTAQEAYFVDHQTYANSINKLIGSTYGLYLSDNITITVVRGNAEGYTMRARHKVLNKTYIVSGPGGEIQVEQ